MCGRTFLLTCLAATGLALNSPPALAEAAGLCEWQNPGTPTSTAEGGVVRFEQALDPSWFACAQELGGELRLEVEVRKRKRRHLRVEEITEPRIIRALFPKNYCKRRKGAHQVITRLVGSGEMDRIAYASRPVEVYCPRCAYKPHHTSVEVMFRWQEGATEWHTETVDVSLSVGKGWLRCARRGSKLAMRFFAGTSRDEVRDSQTPVLVLTKLERSARHKTSFPRRALCQHNPKIKFIAFDFAGTGEMQVLAGREREIREIDCRDENDFVNGRLTL